MARDTNGTFSLPESPFQANTIADPAKVNSVLSDLGAALTDSVSRSGKGGLTADLSMGGRRAINMADGVAATDAATKGQVNAITATLPSLTAAAAAAARAADNAVLVPLDGTRRAAVARADAIEAGTPLSGAGEGPVHARAPDLGTAAGAVQTVGVMQANTSNADRVQTVYVRTAAGASWSTAEARLRRMVDSSETGAIGFLGNGGVYMGNGAGKQVWVDGSGNVLLNATSGVNAGLNSIPGTTQYDPSSNAGQWHINVPNAAGLGNAIAINRSSSTGPMLQFYGSNVAIGSIAANGGGGTNYNTTSDYRLKRSVEPIRAALWTVLRVPAVRFKFRSDPDGALVHGFLAHEVAEYVPEAVTGTKDGVREDGTPAYQALDHSRLVPLLWAAVQELTARVQKLEGE